MIGEALLGDAGLRPEHAVGMAEAHMRGRRRLRPAGGLGQRGEFRRDEGGEFCLARAFGHRQCEFPAHLPLPLGRNATAQRRRAIARA